MEQKSVYVKVKRTDLVKLKATLELVSFQHGRDVIERSAKEALAFINRLLEA